MARLPIHSPKDDPATNDDADSWRVVMLVHGPHKWRFTCAPGEEHALVTAVARLAMQGNTSLDLADAAILARRLDAWPAQEHRKESTHTTD